MSRGLYFAVFIAIVITHGVSASSWQSSLQASRDIYLSFGERHSREHFPTTEYLSDALVHQLEVLSLGSDNVNLMFGPDFFTDAQRSAA